LLSIRLQSFEAHFHFHDQYACLNKVTGHLDYHVGRALLLHILAPNRNDKLQEKSKSKYRLIGDCDYTLISIEQLGFRLNLID